MLLRAVANSCINYVILFAPIYLVETHGLRTVHPFLYPLFYVFVFLLAPAVARIFSLDRAADAEDVEIVDYH